jgi:hypothetical protein
MLTHVAEPNVPGQGRLDKGASRFGQEHLAAMSGRRDASRTMHVDPHVVVAAQLAFAGVEPHSHQERAIVWPVRGSQLPLRIDRGAHRTKRRRKNRKEGIPLRGHLCSAVCVDSAPQDGVMGLEGRPKSVAKLLHEAG